MYVEKKLIMEETIDTYMSLILYIQLRVRILSKIYSRNFCKSNVFQGLTLLAKTFIIDIRKCPKHGFDLSELVES